MLMKRGLIIDIEALDGAGKETQSRLLTNRLNDSKSPTLRVDFPNYKNEGGKLVKKYLAGKYINKNVDNLTYVNQMSLLYSMDRVTTFMEKDDLLGKSIYDRYLEGFNIILDRYTNSNLLHQPANLENPDDVEKYMDWLEDMEYNILKLPRPDITIFLDVPYDIALKNIEKRGVNEKDSHETLTHLKKVYEMKDKLIERCNWVNIECCENGELLPIKDINDIIYDKVMELIYARECKY